MIKKYFWQLLTIILIIIIFLQNSCESNDNNKTGIIVTPEKKGSFSSYKPTSINLPNYIFFNGKDTVELENPINKELESKYLQAEKEKDSLKLKLLYYEAIQMRKYHEVYEDKNIVIDVFANTTGTLDSLGVKYKTKEDSIRLKQPVFRLLAGPELQLHNNQLFPAASIGIQNKKGNIFEGSYNTNGDFSIGYKHNIWTIKK